MWTKVVAGASVVAIALLLVFYVSHLPAITVAEVSVTGANLVSADAVQNIASAQLAGSYGFIVPHDNALVVPGAAIRSAIQKAFPPVASVSISEKGFKTLNIAITERQAAAVWCSGTPGGEISQDAGTSTPVATEPDSSADSDCYSMDPSGFIFATSTGSDAVLKYYGALSAAPVGSTYLKGDFASLNKAIKDIGVSINQVPEEVIASADNNDVSLAFASGGVLRFIRSSDPQPTLENIASVFASQGFKDHTNFEYVDFRFGDKVYVKFK